MNRFMGKSFILFLLLASLSGATFLSPKQNVSSGLGATAGAICLEPGANFGRILPGSSGLRQYTAGGTRARIPGGRSGHRLREPCSEGGVRERPACFACRRGRLRQSPRMAGGAPRRSAKSPIATFGTGSRLSMRRPNPGWSRAPTHIQPGRSRGFPPVGRDPAPLQRSGQRSIESGDLVLSFATGEMRETRPVAWQEVLGKRVGVEVGYSTYWASGKSVSGSGAYDPRYPLVIDPVAELEHLPGRDGYRRGPWHSRGYEREHLCDRQQLCDLGLADQVLFVEAI